ncbi:cell surface protein [Flavobacteriaceae bacterium GSB9]|nr:cell surface protein [Flavobacteriaceae bacterium GSB9]
MKNIFLSIIAMSFLVFSCSEDNDDNLQSKGDYENGILVSGEGGPSSVSFISNDFLTIENGIYYNINNESLGVYLQSIGFNDDMAYIITDNANTINVVNRYTFEKLGTITTDLSTPRYMAFANGKGYVTNWGDGMVATDDFIAVVDLATNSVESTIPVGEGPEQILVYGDKIYVSHKGGYSSNNIISVIDIASNNIETIIVNDNPDEMIIDNLGNLVVLCGGATEYDSNWNVVGHTEGSVTKIDLSNNTVISTLALENGVHPSLMDYDNGVLYYVASGNLFGLTDSDTALPSESVMPLTASYAYGMAVKDNTLYVTDASFTGQSDLIVYDLSSKSEIGTYKVGLGASKIYFN